MSIKKIILVFKTHFDIGFTQLSSEIIKYYSSDMLDRVAETCDATADMGALKYVWTMPSWPLKVMRDENDGARAKMIDDLVERGQLAWHALPYTSHYDFCGIADSIWGLRYGRELAERYGKPMPRAAKMTDVPGYGRFLPEMLADAGILFLHLGSNEFATPPSVPKLFWWEAPSGKRVLTMYNSGYGTGIYAPEDWPLETWVALMNTNDNCGPQTSELVFSIYEKLRKRYPDAEIVCGTLENVLDALCTEDLAGLPVVRGDLADTWIHGVASYPKESAMVRRLRGRLNRVNRALVQCKDEDTAKTVREDVARALDAMTLYAEHTWGLDVKTWLGEIPDYDDFDAYRADARCIRMEESWNEQRERVKSADEACRHAETLLGLVSPAKEQAQSWKTLSGECSVSGESYRLDFSADTGVIHGLLDLKKNNWLLRESDGAGVFSYRYDRYGVEELTEFLRSYGYRFSDWGVKDYGRIQYPECPHVVRRPVFQRCEQCGDAVRFTFRASEGDILGDAERVVLTVRVPQDDAPVRVRLELQGKHATPYVESGALCMPLAAEKPCYFVNKTGSVLNPEKDIVHCANHAFYALEHFIAAQDECGMVGVVSHDCPLVSLGENGVFTYHKEYEEHEPEFRFCLFNNMWGTNFPQWIEGDMTFEFDVFSEEPGCVGSMYAKAAELAENPDGCAALKDPFELSAGLRIGAMTPTENGVLLHIHHCEDAEQEGSVSAAGWRFTEVDLHDRELSGKFEAVYKTRFAPYDLRTIRAEKIG